MTKNYKSVMHTFDGQVIIKERPIPETKDQFVLVENHYSMMSPGTHVTILKNLRKEKNPDAGCYTLGYEGAGIVKEVGNGVDNVKPGDKVAIYGSPYTYEGEYCLVPKLLCHKIPDGVSLEEASTAGLGVIAMHAVRRANIEMGSKVLVVGLGVLGIMASQMVENSGGYLLACGRSDRRRIDITKNLTSKDAYLFSTLDESITEAVKKNFGDEKLDAVITLTTSSAEMGKEVSMNTRGRGTIVIAGGPIGLEAGETYGLEQYVYNSRAGGPGRGMAAYEQEGKDFPIEYVRFTEGRNMEIYLEHIRRGLIDVKPILDAIYPFEKAPEVYEEAINRTSQDIAPILKFK